MSGPAVGVLQPSRAFAQHEFLHLAGRGLGQVGEDEGLGQLEAGQMLCAVLADLGLGDRGTGLQGDEGAGRGGYTASELEDAQEC